MGRERIYGEPPMHEVSPYALYSFRQTHEVAAEGVEVAAEGVRVAGIRSIVEPCVDEPLLRESISGFFNR